MPAFAQGTTVEAGSACSGFEKWQVEEQGGFIVLPPLRRTGMCRVIVRISCPVPLAWRGVRSCSDKEVTD